MILFLLLCLLCLQYATGTITIEPPAALTPGTAICAIPGGWP
jgi:hypothetical protein